MRPSRGDVIAEKYRVERPLGEGGMGTVFAAANLVTGKQVAIKWLKPELAPEEYAHRFMREAQVASRIEHPNVVNVFDMGRHEGALFLVMELLHGDPLSALLDQPIVEVREFLRLMMPVLRGVHAAHRLGVVHRDLKPDNIFVCRDHYGEAREPKVLDFGISKIAEGSLAANKQLTREGAVFGTPQYMAPEQLRNVRAADARSDIYSLGVILYRALSGRLPYDADTLPALVLQIVDAHAVHLAHLRPDLDPALCDTVMRAMAQEPAARYANIGELARALEPFAGVRFETTAPTMLSSSTSEPYLASARTPPSGPGRLSNELSPTVSEHSADLPLSSGPVPTERPSTEAVPTPVTGLKTRPARRNTYLLAGAVVFLWLGTPALWLALRHGEADADEPSAQMPPPLPERAQVPAASAPAPEPELTPTTPAMAPVPAPAPPVVEPAEAAQPAQAVAPQGSREARESRHHRASRTGEAEPEAKAEHSVPAAPSVEPAPTKERADPTLRSDGNPYLQR